MTSKIRINVNYSKPKGQYERQIEKEESSRRQD